MQPVKFKFGRGVSSQGAANRARVSFAEDSGSLLNFSPNQPTNTVSIDNIPERVNRHEIVALFNTLIGEVRSFQNLKDSSGRLEITFPDRDTATKALCLNGYAIAGANILVSAVAVPSTTERQGKSSTDDRRNLYVLGLPFALTKNEFAALFSQHGVVSHCVILATVDNSSRRRGFVVMASHEEAKRAMVALTRTQVNGHIIDVSWAVVQRSQGFLDGGDRALLLDSRSRLPSPSPKLFEGLQSSDSSDSSLGSPEADHTSLAASLAPTPSLLVSNLPTLLFSGAQDLQPLFFPFGHIEKLEIVQVSPLGTMSVVVQYASASIAQEARDNLNGQLYGSYQIEARYVRAATSTVSDGNFLSSIPDPHMNGGHDPAFDPLSHHSSTRFQDFSHNGACCSSNMDRYPPRFSLSRHGSFLKDSGKIPAMASAIYRPFSAASKAYPVSRPTSSGSRWGAGHKVDPLPNFPYQFAFSNQRSHTFYQSSTTA